MQFKKLCASLLSGILAVGALLTPLPNSIEVFKTNDISITAEAASTMRRPCDPEHPMLIVHIDTWNVADPAKIIALIPEDIRPYCVFTIKKNGLWYRTDTNEQNHG